MGVHGAFKRPDGSVHMHNPQNLLRMSLKPTPVSLAVEKQRAKQGFAQGGAAKSLGKGGEAPSVPAEYVANLQQQIFFLERKLEVQAQGGLGGMGGLGGGAASALPGGEPVSGLRGHFQQLEAEFGAKLRTHEAQVEALTQQRVAAQLGEQRAVQLVAEADARVEAAGHRLSEARQELTAEVVGLQKELDSASLAHKSTREELKELVRHAATGEGEREGDNETMEGFTEWVLVPACSALPPPLYSATSAQFKSPLPSPTVVGHLRRAQDFYPRRAL